MLTNENFIHLFSHKTVGCEQYKNLPDHKKQSLVEYRKNYLIWQNTCGLYYNLF